MAPFNYPRSAHRRGPAVIGRLLTLGVALRAGGLLAAGAVDPALHVYEARPAAPRPGAGYVLPGGAIEVAGSGDMAGIVARWNARFAQSHPGVTFHYFKSDDLAALQSLTYDATAFAPVEMPFLSGAMGPYKILVKAPPFGIRVAHASLNPAAAVSPWAIVVPRGNPLDRLTAGQVARIFSAGDRKSGFTYWRQVGVTGELGDREIHPWGLPASDHYPSEDAGFADSWYWGRFGGSPPPLAYQTQPTYAAVAQKVAQDPQAIGITELSRVTPDLKVVAVSGSVWSPPSRGSAADLTAGDYPYDRDLYIYARRLPGEPLDPLVREYLRLVLSREGQQAVADDPLGYRPLSAGEAAAERRQLE